jgi:hypothetical protein
VLGAVEETIDTQHEFYDGIFSGSEEVVTSQSLFYNPFARQTNIPVFYTTVVNNLDPYQLPILTGLNVSGDISSLTGSSVIIDNVDLSPGGPGVIPGTFTNLQVTASNGVEGIVMSMNATSSTLIGGIEITSTGSGFDNLSDYIQLQIPWQQFSGIISSGGVSMVFSSSLFNTGSNLSYNIDQYVQGPAYIEDSGASPSDYQISLANGYRYIPSSSLLVTTASCLDQLDPQEIIIWQYPSNFNLTHLNNYGPTSRTEGQMMQPDNRPLIIGLWRQDWGWANQQNFLSEMYSELLEMGKTFTGDPNNPYDYSQWWQEIAGTLGTDFGDQILEEGFNEGFFNPDYNGMDTPVTRSFYVSYTGIPYIASPSVNLAGSSSLGNIITTNTVAGIGENALSNPRAQTIENYFKQYPYYNGSTFGNLNTPTLKADLTVVFPGTSSYSYNDESFGGEDYRIIDLATNGKRTSLAFYNTSPIIPRFQKNWNDYVFQIYQNNAEDNLGQRPIYQYGTIPSASQLVDFGNSTNPAGATLGSGLTGARQSYKQLYKVVDSEENSCFVATTNQSALLPFGGGSMPSYRNFFPNQDIWAYDDFGSGLEIRPLEDVLDFSNSPFVTVDSTPTSSGDTGESYPFNTIIANLIYPDNDDQLNGINGKYYTKFQDPSPTNPSSTIPLPNDNYAFITASWDTHQSYSGTQNDYDVKPIHTTRPAVGSSVVSSNRYVLSNFYSAQQNAFEDISTSPPTLGSSSLYPFAANITSSFPQTDGSTDVDYYSGSVTTVPTALSINNQSVNPTNGNTIENALSFAQRPIIRFNLAVTGIISSIATNILNDVPNNVIRTDQLVTSSTPFVFGTYTSLYTPDSRKYYGEFVENGYNFSTKYSQYNIDPYIEDTGIGFFENTIYYATPNNFNENRPNKFKYVIENQNGINTISNLQQIFSGSAQQAETPESNYTMKASVIPRYSGSKVTSADYNFYSPPTDPKLEVLTLGTGSFEIVNSFNVTGSSAPLIESNVRASTTTGKGTGAEFTFNFATSESINSIIVTNRGRNYKPGDTLSFTSQSLGATTGSGTDLNFRLNSDNFTLLKPTMFANGTSGSWTGDESYGKTAALDKNPIYFAHFKSSRNNLELDDTYTFSIDQLILAPFNDITKDALTTGPQTIDINGSNNRLLDVVNTFEKGRKASITYQVPIQTYPVLSIPRNVDIAITQSSAITQSVTTNYQTLKIGDNSIFQAGAEFETLASTQPDGIGPNFLTSASLTIGQNVSITPYPGSGSVNGKETISYLGESPLPTTIFRFGKGYWAFASGSDLDEGGYIDLKGGPAILSASLAPGGVSSIAYYGGDILAMAHNYNYWVEDQLLSEFTASAGTPTLKYAVPGLPTASSNQSPLPIPSSSLSNYSSFNFSASEAGANILGYEDFNLPFLIQRGDEIRVTYDINFSGSGFTDITKIVQQSANFRTQDFVVKSIGASDITDPGYYDTSPSMVFNNSGVSASISSSRMFDRLFVEPNPATLAEQIPNGQIYQFTVRRKINADDRIIIYQTPPINALGSQTPTGDGYLIPNDFTPIQKKNVQTLINQLKSQNAVNTSTVAQQSPNQDS